MKDLEAAFGRIAEGNLWGSDESLSGPGSTVEACRTILTRLPEWLWRHGICSIADLGCGDFHWMKELDLDAVRYDGYDVVREIVLWNRLMHEGPRVRFHRADFLDHPTPEADLVLVKDVFIHLPAEKVKRCLGNIKRGRSKWLAATTHEGAVRVNEPEVGGFAPIDLERQEFGLGSPVERIEVPHSPRNPPKFLALWKL